MDPRHPEQAIARLKELMEQYDRIEKDINRATTSALLGQLEREGGLVIQEICLVAPRIHDAMIQSARNRRSELTRGNVYAQMKEYAATAEIVEEPEVGIVSEITGENGHIGMVNPKKKTTRKKKTTKKAKK